MISLNTSSNNRLRLMRSLWLVVIGASFTLGCKTTGSGLKDQSKDSPEIGYHCSFTSPRDVFINCPFDADFVLAWIQLERGAGSLL